MAYLAGDGKYRAAPLIVGKYSAGTMSAAPVAAVRLGGAFSWPMILGATLGLLIVLRLAVTVVRSFSGARSGSLLPRPTVTDQIDPEALNAWVEHEQDRAVEDEFEDDTGPDNPETR